MILLKTKEDIDLIRKGGKILASVLQQVSEIAKPGVTTGDLEELACRLIAEAGGRPAFKGYQTAVDDSPFPTALCTSINDEVVHGPALPPRTLKEGDIIGIDVGMEYPFKKGEKGLYTDMARTVIIGEVDDSVKKLVRVTKECLNLAIDQVKPGNFLSDIGRAVQTHAEKNGFSVVRDLVGHGVGYEVHEDPQIPNYEIKDNSLDNFELKPGMVIAIEPMINMGKHRIQMKHGDWAIRTADKSLSAHFEHTIAVTDDGHRVLTNL
jgi:methionyl aminopeptidase